LSFETRRSIDSQNDSLRVPVGTKPSVSRYINPVRLSRSCGVTGPIIEFPISLSNASRNCT